MNFTNSTPTEGPFANVSVKKSTECYVEDASSVKIARVVAYSFLITVSLIANTFVMVAIYKYGRARKTINYTIMNMSVSNLLITTVYMPRMIPMYLFGTVWLVKGEVGYVLCKTVPFVHGIAVIAAVLTLLGTSIDTFCAVVFPLKKLFTIKVAKITVFATWATAIVVRLPYFISLRTKTSKGKHSCGSNLRTAFNNEHARDIYYTFLFVAMYSLPWLGIVVVYVVIAVRLKMVVVPQQETITAFPLNRARARATRNIIRMTVIITFVFLVCWIAYFLAHIAYSTVPCSFRFWRMFLAHSSCAITPLLFAIFNSTIRRMIKNVFRKIQPPRRYMYSCDAFIGNVYQKKAMMIRKQKIYISRVEYKQGANAYTLSAATTVQLSRDHRRQAARINLYNRKEIGVMNIGKKENCDSGGLLLNIRKLESVQK